VYTLVAALAAAKHAAFLQAEWTAIVAAKQATLCNPNDAALDAALDAA